MLRDLDSSSFSQAVKPELWLFACREKRGDLRGTGAWRYIEAMADHSASEKKQAGKSRTIKEALEAQSGGVWYAPKARPSCHNVWLRKAFNAVYAPFLFARSALVDQRLNSISPIEGVEWKELAAALTSSLFAYSLEINGAASMGAGALEAPTKKLRDYPVFDVTKLKVADKDALVSLAESVWATEAPLDWLSDNYKVGPRLRDLDEWILRVAGRKVAVDRMYDDIRSVCRSRIAVANDKKHKIKKRESDSIGSVAGSIAETFLPKLQTRSFPDDFVDGIELDLPFIFDRSSIKEIVVNHLLDTYDIEVHTRSGNKAYHGSHPRPVAEAIVRALLWGRSTFSVSTNRKAMDEAVNKFIEWVSQTEADIESAISQSAFGTGYEVQLKREVYSRLGIHPLSGSKTLPQHITLSFPTDQH
jgi:hypothetical protein